VGGPCGQGAGIEPALTGPSAAWCGAGLIEHRAAHGGKVSTQRKDGAAAKFPWSHRFVAGPVAGTMSAICQATMFPCETSWQATRRQATELRRYAREAGLGPVVLETREGWLRAPLIDLSPGGAKVRLTEPLKEGTKGRLYLLPPHWRIRTVEAIVWRVDLDGIVFRFTGASTGRPPAARAVRPPGSWLWTWEAQARASVK
jgi:hypothetical protein